MELITKSVLPQHLKNLSASKTELYNQIVDDEDVKFQWSMMSHDIQDEDHSMELLETIVEELDEASWACCDVSMARRL